MLYNSVCYIVNGKGSHLEIFSPLLTFLTMKSFLSLLHPRAQSGLNHMLFHCLYYFFYYLFFYFFNFCVLFFFPSFKNRSQHILTSLLTLRQYFPHFGTKKFRKEDCPQYSGSQEGKTISLLSRFKTEDILLCCLILTHL